MATLLVIELGAAVVLAADRQHEPRVAVRVSACSQPFETALRRMLALELGDLLDDARAERASNLESVEIACATEKAQIAARSASGDQVARNDLRFDAFPSDAAPRAVALAALEALRAVDPTLTERLAAQRADAQASATPDVAASARSDNPPVKVAARPAVAKPAETTAPAERIAPSPALVARPFSRLTLGGGARHFVGAPATTLLGVRLELSRRFSAPLDVGLDLDGAMTRRHRVTLGTVEARLLSSAAWLAARAGGADWSASAGLGGRVGLVDLEGAPDLAARGHRVLRPLAGPLLMVRTDGAVGSLALGIVGEAGYALAGAQGLAGGASALRLDGMWMAVSANAGLRFAL
jgi:hypothetical protein